MDIKFISDLMLSLDKTENAIQMSLETLNDNSSLKRLIIQEMMMNSVREKESGRPGRSAPSSNNAHVQGIEDIISSFHTDEQREKETESRKVKIMELDLTGLSDKEAEEQIIRMIENGLNGRDEHDDE